MRERLIPHARPDDTTGGGPDEKTREKLKRQERVLKDLSEKSGQLVDVVRNLKFENYERFEFDGVNFLLLITKPTRAELKNPDAHVNSRSPAVVMFSTAIDGFDIYLVHSVPREEKIRMVFHEVFEAILSYRGFGAKESHAPTLKEEERVFGPRNST